nr:MAG TPA: hypothetical protein [Caudoviricetes sp.]
MVIYLENKLLLSNSELPPNRLINDPLALMFLKLQLTTLNFLL